MKKVLFFTTFCFVLSVVSKAQVGEIWGCHTQENNSINIQSIPSLRSGTTNFSAKVVNIFVHILKKNDGSGGLSDAQVTNWISHLSNDYIENGIIINVIGQANLNNTTLYNGITSSNYSTLIGTNTHSNAFDIYLLSPTDTYSQASGIPGTALSVGGSYVGTSVLSHELGHCLGLYHTHSGRGCGDNANCSENTDGSNCSSCGDLICDTPADPCLSGNVNTNCVYIGNNSFNPDVHNIMSYAPPSCLSHFSNGQKEKIHTVLSSLNAFFGSRITNISISGSSVICSTNTNSTYTIPNLPSGVGVTWSYSSNLVACNGNINGTTVYIANYNYYDNEAWVKATISFNGVVSYTLPQKDIILYPTISGTYTQANTSYYNATLYSSNNYGMSGGNITINLQNIL